MLGNVKNWINKTRLVV